MTACDLTELRQFFSGYFHEDWQLDSSEPDEVIAQFLMSGPSQDEIDRIVAQIACYLDAATDNAAIERGLLVELGCYYLPDADGVSARDWLGHVAALLAK